MKLDDQQLRLEGIYRQNEQGEYMQRVKLAGGVLSLAQARALADLGQRFGSGIFHLTTRASVEFHGLRAEDLPELHRGLAAVGLFSRGACGGAVRGISCSSSFGPGFGRIQVLLRHYLHHFSGNPHYEGLPKKFKIAFEAGYERSRHLIQDLALVLVDEAGEDSRYDLWLAGGLGREPQAAFLFGDRVPEAQLLPLVESIIEVYKSWGTKGRRLKHMLNEVGEAELRGRIARQLEGKPALRFSDGLSKALVPAERSQRIALNIFAGELPAQRLAEIAALAAVHNSDWLLVTPDQDIELLLEGSTLALEGALVQAGFELLVAGSALRICPGNHECRMGLCATRDLALRLRAEFGVRLNGRTLAISGCANSCAQPQLAEFGIVASKLKREGEQRIPKFDLYRNRGEGLGRRVAEELSEAELLERLKDLLSGTPPPV
jgi:sulfite reductase beta subunit-like hemoprotein